MIQQPEPPKDCQLCPRLVTYREDVRAREPGWYNGAVPSFGDPAAELLILGLAPGVTGAHRTGRPFTGDYAGDLLYATLTKFGFANGKFAADPADGLELHKAMVTNAVRCVPPQNKPIGAEINNCRPFMLSRLKTLPDLRAIVCLGRIAHDTLIRGLGERLALYQFAHQARHQIGELAIFDSYHCSRYNTNTGRLTTEMFEAVFRDVRAYLN
ncbi:uracil-DNA glycosylase [Algicella marina]|uniref:Type-5 uracil-DNA glycosylase n=1 Tax=Algicella marina TaxID=2683284 RepID=A0A6P1T5J3_9RHOB|nr:uracil-DNA glycosylase [Algicella marina]QHQ37071.1 uracil-DNA glycosylase [Algicella marina]